MPLAPMTRRTPFEDVRVCDLMTPNPTSVRHGIAVREAAAFLAAHGVGAAPVVNDAGRAVGVLSRSDVLLAAGAGVEAAPVREVMSPGVIAVQPNADARQAFEIMTRCMVRRVFVTDDEGVPVGVVSADDLFRALLDAWDEHPAVAA
jgi:predicted transcriptional regulator